MTLNSWITLAALWLAIAPSASPEETFSEPDGTLTFRPHPRLSKRRFVIEGREDGGAGRVAVFRLGKNGPARVQTLHGPAESRGALELLPEAQWRVEDFNFDGYQDVGLL